MARLTHGDSRRGSGSSTKAVIVSTSCGSADVAATQRMISPSEVEATVLKGDLIEDYPNDPRGHSCLMLGYGETGRAVHVVCSPKDEYLATAYLPDPGQWSDNFRRRR